jgi:hypothetical protein
LTLARPKVKVVHIINSIIGTMNARAESAETHKISAESAKKVFVTGLFSANAFV